MNYTQFFQDAIEDQYQAKEQARQRTLLEHAQVINLLAPLLNGLDAFLNHTYRYTHSGQWHEGELHRYDEHAEPHEPPHAVFALECHGHLILTIQLTGTSVEIRNSIQRHDWPLNRFNEQDVESMAHTIAEWITPHIV